MSDNHEARLRNEEFCLVCGELHEAVVVHGKDGDLTVLGCPKVSPHQEFYFNVDALKKAVERWFEENEDKQ